MKNRKLLYEGKAKKIFTSDKINELIVSYKDDATALNGLKKGVINEKGIVNNKMSNLLMLVIESKGVPTHYIKQINDRETLVKKVNIVPLEVIVRNIASGSFSKRYGVEEGVVFSEPTLEFSYKNDNLADPLLNSSHVLALNLCSKHDLNVIKEYALKINCILKEVFEKCNIKLVDFKLEFGKRSCKMIAEYKKCNKSFIL